MQNSFIRDPVKRVCELRKPAFYICCFYVLASGIKHQTSGSSRGSLKQREVSRQHNNDIQLKPVFRIRIRLDPYHLAGSGSTSGNVDLDPGSKK